MEAYFKLGTAKVGECHSQYEGYVLYFMTKDKGIPLERIYSVLPENNPQSKLLKEIAKEAYEFKGNDRLSFLQSKYNECFNKIKFE